MNTERIARYRRAIDRLEARIARLEADDMPPGAVIEAPAGPEFPVAGSVEAAVEMIKAGADRVDVIGADRKMIAVVERRRDA